MRNSVSVTTMCLLALTCSAVLPGSASADIISYQQTYGPEAAASNPHVVASLPLFDPGFGTLTKVTVELESTATGGSICWDNEAPIPSDVTLGIGAEVSVSMAGLFTLVTVPLQLDSAFGVAADEVDGAGDFLGADAFAMVGGSGNDSDMDMSTDPAILAAFTGIGSFDAILSSLVKTYLSTNGGYGPIDPVPGVTDGIVKVTYEYIVPEPAAASLMLIGGILLLRRRR